jgi:hypothetical protein
VKARLRRISALVFRPVAVAFDPRIEGLEYRLRQRLLELENHVATDAEVAVEMTTLQARSLGGVERRLAAIEERLGRIEELLSAPVAPR